MQNINAFKLNPTAEDEGAVPRRAARTVYRGRGSHSRAKYNNDRKENFRVDKGRQYMRDLQASIVKDLYVGEKTIEDALAKLEQDQTLQAITTTITTRGIGFGLINVYFISINYNDNISLPSIYSLYRVALAQIEVKVQTQRRSISHVPRFSELIRPFFNKYDMLEATKALTMSFTPIAEILNSIGPFSYYEKYFIPALPPDVTDSHGHFIPRPENIVLSNLRQTVVALADPDTPVQYRAEFVKNNSIPGAIFNESDVLLNPDEIIPSDYTPERLVIDVGYLFPFLSRLERKIPKLVGKNSLTTSGPGSVSQLISNKMENLQIPVRHAGEDLRSYYARCYPVGNITEFWCSEKLTHLEAAHGQSNIIGELPAFTSLRSPLFTPREEAVAAYAFNGTYRGVFQIKYAP